MRLLTFLLCLAFIAATPATAADDRTFLLARDAWRAGSIAKLEAALPGLSGHPLESYARYWALQLRIDQVAPEDVDAFLTRYADTVLAAQLRKDWLRELGRRAAWQRFDALYAQFDSPDTELACYSATARGGQAIAPEALGAWAAAREIPEGCRALVDAAVAAGEITPEQVWLRLRALGRARQTDALRRTLGYLQDAPPARQFDLIDKDPLRFLERAGTLDLRRRDNRELVIYALHRAAPRDPEAAETRWSALRPAFSDTDQAYVWGQLGLQAARNHLPQALDWYARADLVPLDDEQLEWRARAALRARDWSAVNTAIERMPEALREAPTWVYWRGRAVQALGYADDAVTLYGRIAGAPTFYGKLAQEELGLPLALPAQRYEPTEPEVAAAAGNPGLRRAVALFNADLWLEGVREWNWALRGMDDRQLLAAAQYARREQIWDRAINTAERTTAEHDYRLRFLAPYRERFAREARAQGLEESWVLGLVRQESRFVAHARSAAGAAGLMQVMPATARWIAKRMGIGYKPHQIADVDTNIMLGTGYLRYVLDSLDASPVLAAAAYNAGPGRARRWKADFPLEGAIYIETIPFSETRDYVKKVMTNTSFYAALYAGEATPTLKQRLGTIPPRVVDEGYAPTITGQATIQ